MVVTFVGCEYSAEEEPIVVQNGLKSTPYIIEEYSDNTVFNLKSGKSYFTLRDLGSECYITFEVDYDRFDTIDYNSSEVSLYDYNIYDTIAEITLVTRDYNYRDIEVELSLFNNAFSTVTVDCYEIDY